MFGLQFSFGWRNAAGLFCVWRNCEDTWDDISWALHFGVQRSNWVWGYYEWPASVGDFREIGLGPLVLLCY